MEIKKSQAKEEIKKLRQLKNRINDQINKEISSDIIKNISASLDQTLQQRVDELPKSILNKLVINIGEKDEVQKAELKNSIKPYSFPYLNSETPSSEEIELLNEYVNQSNVKKKYQDLKNKTHKDLEEFNQALEDIIRLDKNFFFKLFQSKSDKYYLRDAQRIANEKMIIVQNIEEKMSQYERMTSSNHNFITDYRENFGTFQDIIARILDYNPLMIDELWGRLSDLTLYYVEQIEKKDLKSVEQHIVNNWLNVVDEKSTENFDVISIDAISRRIHNSEMITYLKDKGIKTLGDVRNWQGIIPSEFGDDKNMQQVVDAVNGFYLDRAKQYYPKFNLRELGGNEKELLLWLYIYRRYTPKEKELISKLSKQSHLLSQLSKILSEPVINIYQYNLLSDKDKEYVGQKYHLFLDELADFIEKYNKISIPKSSSVTTDQVLSDFEENSASYYSLFEKSTGAGSGDNVNDLPTYIIDEVNCFELNETELKATLRPYQTFGTKYILTYTKTLLGDEMGLGKTIQAIAAMNHLYQGGSKHSMVLCPLSVLPNWSHEIRQWSSLPVHIYRGYSRERELENWLVKGGVLLTNFEQTKHLLKRSRLQKIDCLVVDEAHNLKNPKAQRTRDVEKLSEYCEFILLMTGTPIENRLDEMKHLLNMLNEPVISRINSKNIENNPEYFKEIIAPVYLRRKRLDVLNELPEIEHIQKWSEFHEIERDYYNKALEEGLAGLNKMRRAGYQGRTKKESPKIKQLLEICEEAAQNDDKIIIFSFFKLVLDILEPLLKNRVVGRIQGGVPPKQRQKYIDKLGSAPSGSILLAQIDSGGTGLNIQAANIVILCEPQWKPSTINQAVSRVYRMGQTKNVQVFHMLSEESLDETILEMLDYKQSIFNTYADESFVAESFEAKENEVNEKVLGNQIIKRERERLDRHKKDLKSKNISNEKVNSQSKSIFTPIPNRERKTIKPKRIISYDEVDYLLRPRGQDLRKYVAVDVETTGRYLTDEIIEVSAVKFVDGYPKESFNQLVKPSELIPAEATEINNITNEMVRNAPKISEVVKLFDEFIGDWPIVGHNLRFDLRFLYRGGSQILRTPRNYYCTHMIGKDRIDRGQVENYKLVTLCGYFGIQLNRAHRASTDAVATGKLLYALFASQKDRYW